MTRPLWPLALALWLGTGPAMAQPVAPGGGDRAVAPPAAGLDPTARQARTAGQRPRLAPRGPADHDQGQDAPPARQPA